MIYSQGYVLRILYFRIQNMIDKDKIPEPTLNELIYLIGENETKKYLEKNSYNYGAVSNKILKEKMKKRFGKKFWYYFFGGLILILIIYYILLDQIII